jgi:hypothetical protein
MKYITIPYPQNVANDIHRFVSDVSGTGEVIDCLMDLWLYANRSDDFKELEEATRENIFHTLKHTLKFVAEMEGSIRTDFHK